MGLLVTLLIGITGFNTWLLMLSRRDVARLRRELAEARAERATPAPPAELSGPSDSAALARPAVVPALASLSPGARVAARFFANVANGALDAAMRDAAENLSRDALRAFHDEHEANFVGLGVTSVDEGDARATVYYADADAARGPRYAATAALLGKAWSVIDVSPAA